MNFETNAQDYQIQPELLNIKEKYSESRYLKENQTVVTLWPVPDGTALERLQQLHVDKHVVLTNQVHSSNVLVVNRHSESQTKNVDGLVTTDGTILAAYGSDCTTITLSDGTVSGIAHVGRAGILVGIIPNLALCLRGVGVNESRTKIRIGPGIHSCCYAINPENDSSHQIQAFIERFGNRVVIRRQEKVFLNLPTAIYQSFLQEGFQSSEFSFDPRCTCCDSLQFPSHRRQGSGRTGQIVTTIEKTRVRQSPPIDPMSPLFNDPKSSYDPLIEIE